MIKKLFASLWQLTTLFQVRIKSKKRHRVFRIQLIQWLKPFIKFNIHKRIGKEKNGDKDGKALFKLMNSSMYGKKMENLRNRIDVRLVSN